LANRFKIRNQLGEDGGTAIVYEAYDTKSRTNVAVKRMKKSHEVSKKLMESEAKFLGSIDHMNVLRLISHGYHEYVPTESHNGSEKENWFYLVIELASEMTLFDQIVKDGPFSEEKAATYFKQMVLGLQAIHNQNICHRDIKPENILTGNNDNDMIKIADFGFAAFLNEELSDRVGTDGFKAPEILKLK
jgi:serine/threonine protein kinase